MPTRPARHGSSSRPATSTPASRGAQAVLLGAAVDGTHGRPVGQSQPVPVAPEAVGLDELQPGLVGEAPVLVVGRVLLAVGEQHERALPLGVGRLEAAAERRGALVEAGRGSTPSTSDTASDTAMAYAIPDGVRTLSSSTSSVPSSSRTTSKPATEIQAPDTGALPVRSCSR